MSTIKDLLKPIYELLKTIYLSLISSDRTNIRNYKILTDLMYKERLKHTRNKFAVNYARHYFSQTDEDGLTLEILKRIGASERPTFLEFGVGDGLENNTLILLAMNWKGTWFGGEKLAFNYKNTEKLKFSRVWIEKENISRLYRDSLLHHKVEQHDVISMDLDGNDIYLIEELLLSGARPKLFICEYNGIFPPHSKWKMQYNSGHVWDGDHYYGASLASFVDLLTSKGYFLCACNPQTGANAFFVKSDYRELFEDVPNNIEEIYVEPCFWVDNKFTHKITPKFIKSLID